MARVRSHKRVTCLHQVHTYSTFTHCLPFPPALSQHTDFPKQAPTQPCSPHTLTPSSSHPPRSTTGAPATHCSLRWVPRGRTREKEWGPGPGHPDGVLRTQPGCRELMVGAFIDGPKRDPTSKCPLPFSPLLLTLNQPHTLWARPVQGSTDESNSVSKLNSTDNLFRPIGHPACSASLTPRRLTQMLHTPAGQV